MQFACCGPGGIIPAWVTVPTGDWFPDLFSANCDYGTTPRPPAVRQAKKKENVPWLDFTGG